MISKWVGILMTEQNSLQPTKRNIMIMEHQKWNSKDIQLVRKEKLFMPLPSKIIIVMFLLFLISHHFYVNLSLFIRHGATLLKVVYSSVENSLFQLL